MKIIFHERFCEVYTSDPAAAAGRMEVIFEALKNDYEFITPPPASEKDLALVHTAAQIESIRRSKHLYEIGVLSAGGAILASELAFTGEPAFGLIRPPGHHASPGSCWGFCYFNNIAIAVKKLMEKGEVKKALILDFDLHFGDGTENSFHGIPQVVYFHPEGSNGPEYLSEVQSHFDRAKDFDILAVSAGFDRHVEDWGGLLTTENYKTIGSMVKTYAQKVCQGRRFAVLEGGYNHSVLGQNVRAFVEGMK